MHSHTSAHPAYAKHTPSIDAKALTSTATWPTFYPQSAMAMAAERQLMAQSHDTNKWEAASRSWRRARH